MSTPEQSELAMEKSGSAADMAPQIAEMRQFISRYNSQTTVYGTPLSLDYMREHFDFDPHKKQKPEVVLREKTAVELGHPSTVSLAHVLSTTQPEHIQNGRITVVGPELTAKGEHTPQSHAQFVMVELQPGSEPDFFQLEGVQYLIHRLPGYMVRSIPGRLWVRISFDSLNRGLSFHGIGSALFHVFMAQFDALLGVEIVFCTLSTEAVNELKPVAREIEIVSGQHKKLSLGTNGDLECTDLDCDNCEEKPVCDDLREIIIKRRKKRQ